MKNTSVEKGVLVERQCRHHTDSLFLSGVNYASKVRSRPTTWTLKYCNNYGRIRVEKMWIVENAMSINLKNGFVSHHHRRPASVPLIPSFLNRKLIYVSAHRICLLMSTYVLALTRTKTTIPRRESVLYWYKRLSCHDNASKMTKMTCRAVRPEND